MERKESDSFCLFLGVCAPWWRLYFPVSENDTHRTHTYAGADPVHPRAHHRPGGSATSTRRLGLRGRVPLGAAACFFCNFIGCPVVWTSQGLSFAWWGQKCSHFVLSGGSAPANCVLKADSTSTSPGAQFLYLVIQLVTLVVSIKTAFIALSPLASARVLLSLLARGPGTPWGCPPALSLGWGVPVVLAVFSLQTNFATLGRWAGHALRGRRGPRA